MTWAEGYVTEVDYTHGYHRELSPTLQRYALVERDTRHRAKVEIILSLAMARACPS